MRGLPPSRSVPIAHFCLQRLSHTEGLKTQQTIKAGGTISVYLPDHLRNTIGVSENGWSPTA